MEKFGDALDNLDYNASLSSLFLVAPTKSSFQS